MSTDKIASLSGSEIRSLASPVEYTPHDQPSENPVEGSALCLSGGGYRAMLFHLGALWRLNELGLLSKLDRISSVSGGSITAGVLGLNFHKLIFEKGVAVNLNEHLVVPIRKLASVTIDWKAIGIGALLPGVSAADKVADAYRKYLFGKATLWDLPERPRFVFNASNVQSKSLWRFSKPYMWDWRVGRITKRTVELAVAVGASSAFPPALSPVELEFDEADFDPGTGAELQKPPYTTNVVLTDGGVYDNLGLETAWKNYKTVLVSDAGGLLGADPDPDRDWLDHTRRIFDLVDNQVRSLRKRQLIASYRNGERQGCYWGIWTAISEYKLPTALPCDPERTLELAGTATRLKGMKDPLQEALINWGYAACDASVRSFYLKEGPSPAAFPYPNSALGVRRAA